uniref:DNA polymerase II subunit 2 n=1 Tax=Leersia perrieri TaxID=77586 RepID=A0A0D9X8Q2_9ORYZ
MATLSAATRKKLQRKFRLRGFTLKVDALEEAADFLARFPDAEDDALDLLLDELDKEPLESSILDRDAVRRVVSLLVEAEEAVDAASPAATSARSALRVVDSFVVPRFHYDPIKKVFYEHTSRLLIHGEAGDKAALYRDRYQVLLQRLARDIYFSKPAFDTVMTEDVNCESLIGCTGRRWIMGVISQLEERQFYLEDLTGAVNTCGFPPLEDREASLSILMGLDFFGGGVIPTEETVRLATLEKKAMNDMFVILSDVWLDSPETMEKLGIVLDGPSKALPRCALPKYLTEELQKHIPNAIFVSNPCRVKFYTQEIVFFRQDLLYRMRRSCLIPPTTEETSDPFEHLVATITHQSHLCPLPLTVQPIIWNYDHCLRLYPTPHTIVLGDKSEQKAFKYTGITCFNPGSFANDSTFAAYRPCTKEVELSALES